MAYRNVAALVLMFPLGATATLAVAQHPCDMEGAWLTGVYSTTSPLSTQTGVLVFSDDGRFAWKFDVALQGKLASVPTFAGSFDAIRVDKRIPDTNPPKLEAITLVVFQPLVAHGAMSEIEAIDSLLFGFEMEYHIDSGNCAKGTLKFVEPKNMDVWFLLDRAFPD